MDPELEQQAREAIERLERVLDRGADLHHDDLHQAILAVIDFRNRAIIKHRAGLADRACLAQANSLTSLAYGAEFPLSGLHLHRLKQTRDGMQELLAEHSEGPRNAS